MQKKMFHQEYFFLNFCCFATFFRAFVKNISVSKQPSNYISKVKGLKLLLRWITSVKITSDFVQKIFCFSVKFMFWGHQNLTLHVQKITLRKTVFISWIHHSLGISELELNHFGLLRWKFLQNCQNCILLVQWNNLWWKIASFEKFHKFWVTFDLFSTSFSTFIRNVYGCGERFGRQFFWEGSQFLFYFESPTEK